MMNCRERSCRVSGRSISRTFSFGIKVLYAILLCLGTWHVVSAGGDSSTATDSSQTSKLDLTQFDSNLDKACEQFDDQTPIGSGWLRSHCATIWNGWVVTLDEKQVVPSSYREDFAETSAELRRRGEPCLVESVRYPDGAGSSAVRYLATWMFAAEMGCDWVMPSQPGDTIGDNGDESSLYCHKMMARGRMHPKNEKGNRGSRFWHCEVTNWQQFFHYDAHAVNASGSGVTKTIQVYIGDNSSSIREAAEEYRLHSGDQLPWDHLLLHLGKSTANRFFQLVPSWDSAKRESTRDVLMRYRESFHQFPRPWFNHLPRCMYSSSPQELNFAIHVRLGDRTTYLNGFEADYVDYVESFMDTVTNAVTRRGLDSPRFHIFSETFSPCPEEKSRTFPEFPAWPAEEYQIQPCLNPVTPEDCPEKRAGALNCNPTRSGIFRVSDKPLYLHVGLDVQNEITCMTKADGVLMGCSTFGQIAGVLNKGLKFFSFECAGARTPNHYKMMPPLAIAEQGNLWVPMAGSWHDPSILSEAIFEAALDQHLEKNESLECQQK